MFLPCSCYRAALLLGGKELNAAAIQPSGHIKDIGVIWATASVIVKFRQNSYVVRLYCTIDKDALDLSCFTVWNRFVTNSHCVQEQEKIQFFRSLSLTRPICVVSCSLSRLPPVSYPV